MAKVKKETLTPEQHAELDAQKASDDGMPEEEGTRDEGLGISEETTGEETTDEESLAPHPSPLAHAPCPHDFVSHMSHRCQDHPGKRFVYVRCVKCNEIKFEVEKAP